MDYLATKQRGSRTWRVLDEQERLCFATGSRTKAEAVAEFLRDNRSPHWEGTRQWIEAHAGKEKPRGWPA